MLLAVIWRAVPMIPWLQSIAKPALSALVMTAPLSFGQIKDSGPVEAEALAELETVEEPAAVEFTNTEVETEAVLAAPEELVEFDGRDSTAANVTPGAFCLDD